MQTLIMQLLGQQQRQQQKSPRNPNNIDQMVVPPFNLPNDKNTFMPQDIMNMRNSPNMWRENI
jgi:hypothetical protein